MNLLIIGSGGREHAIASKLATSQRVKKIFVSPGNGGTEQEFENVILNLHPPFGEVIDFCQKEKIGLVVIGPENYLSNGIVDCLQNHVATFGPSKAAAQLESSKVFAKKVMLESSVPTASYEVFEDFDQAKKFIGNRPLNYVLKANGLCAGKGVVIPETKELSLEALKDFLIQQKFGTAGNKVVIEDKLIGSELSVLGFCDGKRVKLLTPAQDHKRAFDNDHGPNTGGMGAYAPVKFITEKHLKTIEETIFLPVLKNLSDKGTPYHGILYAGLMFDPSNETAKVIEFNVRFGDPECQCILPLLKGDLLEIMLACIRGNLDQVDFDLKKRAVCTVVLASGGYPNHYQTGKTILGLDQTLPHRTKIFHAGTKLRGETLQTSGGRVLCVSTLGETGEPLSSVIKHCYQTVETLHFDHCFYRKDIGRKGI